MRNEFSCPSSKGMHTPIIRALRRKLLKTNFNMIRSNNAVLGTKEIVHITCTWLHNSLSQNQRECVNERKSKNVILKSALSHRQVQ